MRPRPLRTRPRPGSLERPINARSYRGTWILVGIPLLLAAFTVGSQQPLLAPTLRPAFDVDAAVATATDLATTYPDRRPGAASTANVRGWISDQFAKLGFTHEVDRFRARIPDLGEVELANISARVQGRSPTSIVILAHRDNSGGGGAGGANDNASGTAAMLELARAYSSPPGYGASRQPAYTIEFVSTDAGDFGAIGADRFARRAAHSGRIAAVIVLDSIAGSGIPRVVINGDTPRSPEPLLVATASELVRSQSGQVGHSSIRNQLLDLAFPFSLYEQAPFVARGIPAITLTTAGDRPPNPLTDAPANLSREHLGAIGRATEQLVAALDQGAPEPQLASSSYLYLGGRFVRGWAIQLILLACLLPALVVIVDLFARCRRRHIQLRPASRSLLRRLGFWFSLLVLFLAFAAVGFWPKASARPLSPDSAAATHWPLTAIAFFCALGFGAWLIARDRLLPRHPIGAEEELAGYSVALLGLAGCALVVVALNRYMLLFLLPPLHAWIWLPQLRLARPWTRLAVIALGLLGPAFLFWSFATRLDLGLDAGWYLTELAAVGYVAFPLLLVAVAFAASTAQLATLAVSRYAPYPELDERPRRNLVQRGGRRVYLFARSRRAGEEAPRRAAEG
jgi:hypothetical protein